MKLNNIRHVSQNITVSTKGYPSYAQEFASIRSVSLNKNKIYKVKNLNVLNTNVISTLSSNEQVVPAIIFNNDEDLINNIYLNYFAQFGSGFNFSYYDSSGSVATTYPYAYPTQIDVEPFNTRIVYDLVNPYRNGILLEEASSSSNTFSYLFYLRNCFSGLFRIMPLIQFSQYIQAGTYVNSYSPVSFTQDFTFYNNLSARLNILGIAYYNLMSMPSTTRFQYNGEIDFDLEEYEAED